MLQRGGADLTTALREAIRALPHTVHAVVEVDRIEPVLTGGAHTVLLDNFTLDELRAAWR